MWWFYMYLTKATCVKYGYVAVLVNHGLVSSYGIFVRATITWMISAHGRVDFVQKEDATLNNFGYSKYRYKWGI